MTVMDIVFSNLITSQHHALGLRSSSQTLKVMLRSQEWIPQQVLCYSRNLKIIIEKYSSRRFTPGTLRLTPGTLSYWEDSIPCTYSLLPSRFEIFIRPRKICAFIVTDAKFSSLTRHRYPVTSHMYGSTKNLLPTSSSSIISLISITSPKIA